MTSPLHSQIGRPLTWVPTATFKTSFDLTSPDGTTFSTLDMSSWTSKAEASVPEGTLFFYNEGWSGRKVAISTIDQGPPIANYQRKWTSSRGQLSIPDGREFTWSRLNFWGTQKAWTDATGSIPYVQFFLHSFSRRVDVEISPQAAEVPELSLLVVFGLYNILVERRSAAAASAAT